MTGLLVASLMAATTAAQPPTAADIMQKVAANQERSQQMRSAFVYNQSVLIRFHRSNGNFCREEVSYFTVSPSPTGTTKTRTYFRGYYARKGELYKYDEPSHNYKEVDIDGELISELADELTSDDDTRDGIASNLFPLTAAEQERYRFRLEGTEKYLGREVYRLTFRPDKKRKDNPGTWRGEALVDRGSFQPVLIITRLAKGVPIWARMLFGTNLKHLGFKVTYEEADDGVWFPSTYGGEFEVKAVFFYKRRISLSLRNTDFERADVSSNIAFGEPVQ
ncbi:MAG: hypothetical protein GY953_09610 [bacterium]|nr:hypothetical protein [bacterium]